jgi:hypothetical protein
MDKAEKTKQDAEKLIAYVSKTAKGAVEELRKSGKFAKPFEFTIGSDNPRKFIMFVKGNKTAGSEYELNCWKSVPAVSAECHVNFEHHPTAPGEHFISYAGFGRSWGVDNPKNLEYVESGYLAESIALAVWQAVEDFTEQHTI